MKTMVAHSTKGADSPSQPAAPLQMRPHTRHRNHPPPDLQRGQQALHRGVDGALPRRCAQHRKALGRRVLRALAGLHLCVREKPKGRAGQCGQVDSVGNLVVRAVQRPLHMPPNSEWPVSWQGSHYSTQPHLCLSL